MSTAIALMERHRAGLSMPGLALRSSEVQTDAAAIKVTSGSGAPNHTAVLNSIYIRTNAASVAEILYRNTDGAATWEALAVTTATLGTANTWDLLQTLTVGARIVDAGVIGWGTAGTDLLMTADGTDLIVTGTGGMVFVDNVVTYFGTGKDVGIAWDGTRLKFSPAAADTAVRWGTDGAGMDQVWYGDTAASILTWDQSADSLILSGVVKIKLQTIAAATATAIPVTHSGSFPVTTAAAETNTLADPTYLGQTISIFADTYAVGDRVITAASRINQTGNTIITLGAVGDFIKLEAITIAGALKWQVVANDGAALS